MRRASSGSSATISAVLDGLLNQLAGDCCASEADSRVMTVASEIASAASRSATEVIVCCRRFAGGCAPCPGACAGRPACARARRCGCAFTGRVSSASGYRCTGTFAREPSGSDGGQHRGPFIQQRCVRVLQCGALVQQRAGLRGGSSHFG